MKACKLLVKYLKFVVVFSVLFCRSVQAENSLLPHSFAALGDSITAGALASHSRRTSIFPDEDLMLVMRLFKQQVDGSSRGDDELDDRYLSWALGNGKSGFFSSNKVKGHRYYLNQLLQKNNEILWTNNFAISGSTANDVLKYQLPRLLKWSANNLEQSIPDYTTLLVGINDLCTRRTAFITPVADYYKDVREILHTLLSKSDTSKVLVLSLPQVQRLRSEVRRARVFGMLSCSRMWKTAKICPIFNTPRNSAERALAIDYWNEYNVVLEQLVEEMRLDYGDRIRLTKKLSEVGFTKNDLAVDCFHPDFSGQQKISNETWQDTWWSTN